MIRSRPRSMFGLALAMLWVSSSPAVAEDETQIETVPLKGPSVRYEVDQRVPSKSDPIEVRVPESAPAVEVPKPVEVPDPVAVPESVEVETTPTRRDIDLRTRQDRQRTGTSTGSDVEQGSGNTNRRNPSSVARKIDGHEYCGRGCGGKAKPFQREQGKWYVRCKDNTKKCKSNCSECSCHLFKSAKGSDEREYHGPGSKGGRVRLPDKELNKDWYCYCVES